MGEKATKPPIKTLAAALLLLCSGCGTISGVDARIARLEKELQNLRNGPEPIFAQRPALAALGNAILEKMRKVEEHDRKALNRRLVNIKKELMWIHDEHLAVALVWEPAVACLEGDYRRAMELIAKNYNENDSSIQWDIKDASASLWDYPYHAGIVLMQAALSLDPVEDKDTVIMLLKGTRTEADEWCNGAIQWLGQAAYGHPDDQMGFAAAENTKAIRSLLEKHYDIVMQDDDSTAVIANTEQAATTKERLKKAVIREIDFRQVPVKKSLRLLAEMIRSVDPEKKAVEIIAKGRWVRPLAPLGIQNLAAEPRESGPEKDSIRVTFSVRRISGWAALVVTAECANASLTIDDTGRVIVAEKTAGGPIE